MSWIKNTTFIRSVEIETLTSGTNYYGYFCLPSCPLNFRPQSYGALYSLFFVVRYTLMEVFGKQCVSEGSQMALVIFSSGQYLSLYSLELFFLI